MADQTPAPEAQAAPSQPTTPAPEEQTSESQSPAQSTPSTPDPAPVAASQEETLPAGKDPQDPQDPQAGDGQEDPEDPEDLTPEELEALDAKTRRNMSKVRRENSNLRDRLSSETSRAARAEAALAAGLPISALKFLTGSTAEELENNAGELLAMMGQGGRTTPPGLPREGWAPVPANLAAEQLEPETDLDAIGSRMYNR